MNSSFKYAIDKYIRICKSGSWVEKEAYKFEFANHINYKIDWETQSDDEILEILIQSQKIKYTTNVKGVQFILKSGRLKLQEFIALKDIELLRELRIKEFSEIDWSDRTMSYTGLSAWVASLFPENYYPIPMKGFDYTIKYLFGVSDTSFPKIDMGYFLECQSYMQQTWQYLKQYPIDDLFLRAWNKYYREIPEIDIPIKTELSLVDRVWIVQDFHLFVHRQILDLYKPKNKEFKVSEDVEPIVIEGESVLAKHICYERNSSFIKKIKEKALSENSMLNCQVCGFSFIEKYGELGEGFIEAHHKNALYERDGESRTKKEDIILVCSNCHRMLHHRLLTLDVEALMEIIAKNNL